MYVMSSLSYMDGQENRVAHQSICTFIVFYIYLVFIVFFFWGGRVGIWE